MDANLICLTVTLSYLLLILITYSGNQGIFKLPLDFLKKLLYINSCKCEHLVVF